MAAPSAGTGYSECPSSLDDEAVAGMGRGALLLDPHRDCELFAVRLRALSSSSPSTRLIELAEVEFDGDWAHSTYAESDAN